MQGKKAVPLHHYFGIPARRVIPLCHAPFIFVPSYYCILSCKLTYDFFLLCLFLYDVFAHY
jgi:hypothetical protein